MRYRRTYPRLIDTYVDVIEVYAVLATVIGIILRLFHFQFGAIVFGSGFFALMLLAFISSTDTTFKWIFNMFKKLFYKLRG